MQCLRNKSVIARPSDANRPTDRSSDRSIYGNLYDATKRKIPDGCLGLVSRCCKWSPTAETGKQVSPCMSSLRLP